MISIRRRLAALLWRRRRLHVIPLSQAHFDPVIDRAMGGFSEHREEERRPTRPDQPRK